MSIVRPLVPAFLLTLAACAPPPDAPPDPGDLALLGTKPLTPLPKVAFTMPDTRGEPFDFQTETDGRIALLFFGYTHCPDVCPLHMATLAAALGRLSPEIRARVRTVFVTVDPERDTPERLEQWLSAFDTSFVGVRGTPDQIAEALAFYRYPEPELGPEETGYLVGHPAFVYAFSPDGLGRAMYGAETREATWVHDLTLLAGHDWSASPGGTAAGTGGASPGVLGSIGSVLVLDAYVAEPPTGATGALYLALLNTGASSDTLLEISAPRATSGAIHGTVVEGGVSSMRSVSGGVPLPPGRTVRLAPGGLHGMLVGLDPVPAAGDTVDVTVRTTGGEVTVRARVVSYAELSR